MSVPVDKYLGRFINYLAQTLCIKRIHYERNKMAKKKAPFVKQVRQTKARAFINKLAPKHEKISCTELANVDGTQVETVDINSRYKNDDFGGCYRCTLMSVLNLAVAGEMEQQKDEDEE